MKGKHLLASAFGAVSRSQPSPRHPLASVTTELHLGTPTRGQLQPGTHSDRPQ